MSSDQPEVSRDAMMELNTLLTRVYEDRNWICIEAGRTKEFSPYAAVIRVRFAANEGNAPRRS